MLIVAVCIAMGSLVACPNNEEKTSKSELGSIKLVLHFPVFDGAEAITKLSVTLEKADETGTPPVMLEKTESDFSNLETGYNTTTLAFDFLPSGQYILSLTFYREEAKAALSMEVVTVQPGEELNKWPGDDGGAYSIRTFEEFRSMTAVASFTLKNSDGTTVLLSMTDPSPRTWNLDKSRVTNNGTGMQLEISLSSGPGTSLSAVTLNREDKLSLFKPTNSNPSIPVYTGTLDIGTGEAIIYVEVQAPDRTTTVTYTIRQSP
jgi:hypothetical protein